MLDGWYCRSIANMQANKSTTNAPNVSSQSHKDYSSDSSSDQDQEPNYRAQYIALKRKLKYLIYENECFQDALRSSQKRLLKVSRDRSFLLDRLLQYERGESSSSESDETESSDDSRRSYKDAIKRKKIDSNVTNHNASIPTSLNKASNVMKRKKNSQRKNYAIGQHHGNSNTLSKAVPSLGLSLSAGDGHMTPEEVERHLQSRQSYLELLPERALPTVPTEMFSNDPSLDSESNDVLENSPNVEEWLD